LTLFSNWLTRTPETRAYSGIRAAGADYSPERHACCNDTQYEQARIAAQWEIFRNQSMGNELLAASFDSLAGNASNALPASSPGSMSAQEAMQSLASNALNSLINGFVQMGVDWVKSAVMGAAAQTSAIATTTAAQTAGSDNHCGKHRGGHDHNGGLDASGRCLNRFIRWAAAIGIAALIAAMAMAGGIAGKRKNGGPVSAGLCTRWVRAVCLKSTRQQWQPVHDPGRQRKVISNKQMNAGAGGSSVPVNINNYTGATVDAQATQDGNGVTIDMIVADINNGGRVSQAIQQNHQAPRKARG
jgi:hypothetical protein